MMHTRLSKHAFAYLPDVRRCATTLLAASIACALYAPAALASLLDVQTAESSLEVPVGFGLRTGFMASDNISRVPEDEEDELIGVLEMVSNWQYQGTRSEAVIAGNLSYRTYTEGDFDDEFRGNLFMGASFDIVPQNFAWRLTNHFANAPINPLVFGGPENTQYYNVLETGPSVSLSPGDRHEVGISAARADVQAEVSEIDHERDTYLASWGYELGTGSELSLNASSQAIRFDDDIEEVDFDREEAYLAYDRNLRLGNLSVAAGKARTEREDGLRRDSGVGWLRWSARRTSNSRIFVNINRRAGDTSSLLNSELLRPGSIWRLVAVGDPFVAEQGFISYTRGVRGHQWSAVASVQRLDYLVSPFDQEQRGLRLNTDLMLVRNLMLTLSAGRVKIDYDDPARIDRLAEVSAEIDYRIDRNWSVVTGARYVDGDSTDPTNVFKETFLTLFVNFTPAGREPLGSGR